MKKNLIKAIGMMVIGAALSALAVLPILNVPKNVQGVCLGLGIGLAGVGLTKLTGLNYAQQNPSYAKEKAIEEQDERNQQIAHRAKSSAADLTQWGILGIAYISIYMNYPLAVTASIVAVYGAYHILTWFFHNHYAKVM